jgi:hypothetical protein
MSARGRGRKRDKLINILSAPFRACRTPSPLSTSPTESWWSAHRTEIVAGVRQVLGLAKEALEGLPVYGPAAAISATEKFLESVQVRNRPCRRLS